MVPIWKLRAWRMMFFILNFRSKDRMLPTGSFRGILRLLSSKWVRGFAAVFPITPFRGIVGMLPSLVFRVISFVFPKKVFRAWREMILIISFRGNLFLLSNVYFRGIFYVLPKRLFRARLNLLNKNKMRAKDHMIYFALLRARLWVIFIFKLRGSRTMFSIPSF